jgi:poly(ADP-ribose) glycohydrolase ARH3
MSNKVTLEQFKGCLLGLAVGDALGAPFEGLSSDLIFYEYGSPQNIIQRPFSDILYYTDDTEMMIGVCETLVECGRIDETVLCNAFVNNYHSDRGYGAGARKIIDAIATGQDYRELNRTIFPGGSLGNGAAMRVAPIGLCFHNNPQRILMEARNSALPTHVHPVGIEGAQLLALAISIALTQDDIEFKTLFQQLHRYAETEEFQWQLSAAEQLPPEDIMHSFGNSLEAHRSVLTAIACFANNLNSYSDTISRAIFLGNDTDTLAAMAGAISGARLGINAIPKHLLDILEKSSKGRDYIEQLAERLFENFVVSPNSSA